MAKSVDTKPKSEKILSKFMHVCKNYLTGSDDDGGVNSSEKWLEDFSHRPSWCDATMALEQIRNGKAEGNKLALYVRSFLQKVLFLLGKFVQKRYGEVLFIMVLIMCFFCIGLRNAEIQIDIIKLWVPEGGRLESEMNFPSTCEKLSRSSRAADTGTTPPREELPKIDNSINGGFQLMIQTPKHTGKDILTREDMLLHTEILSNISRLSINVLGEDWYLHDMCFKPPAPAGEVGGAFGDLVNTILDKIIPCIIVSPLDCFWDGAKPLGPFPPIDIPSDIKFFLPSVPTGNVTWKNLNPTKIINEVGSILPLGDVGNMFERVGLGAGYLDRHCIDPLDPECPPESPNYLPEDHLCIAVNKYLDENPQAKNTLEKDDVKLNEDGEIDTGEEDDDGGFMSMFGGKKRRRRQAEEPLDDYYADLDTENSTEDTSSEAILDNLFGETEATDNVKVEPEEEPTKKPVDSKKLECLQYGRSVRNLFRKDYSLVDKYFAEGKGPQEPPFAELLTGGCKSFAKDILVWSEQLIVGGIQRQGIDPESQIETAEALQSVFLVSGGMGIYNRFKDGHHSKPNLDKQAWNPGVAGHIVNEWQRKFTRELYALEINVDDEGERQVHPLASTSITDMLAEFSKFKYGVLLIGYCLMILYAGLSLFSFKGGGVESCAGLGMIGVLLVTFASASGLGLSSWCGIDFNAATTQIVPFLTLGLGVDDMFLLVHNYQEIVGICNRHELGYLLKETGLSVLLTSINNILAFCAGGLLPVPALRSFCFQTAILLVFNLVAITTIYPAIMAIDLNRRKRNMIDVLCCIPASQFDRKRLEMSSANLQSHNNNNDNPKFTKSAINPPTYDQVCDLEAGPRSNCKCPRFSWDCLTLEYFVNNLYIPILKHRAVKVAVILFFVITMSLGLVGLSRINMGLDLSDVIAKNTAPYAFIVAREKYFSFYPMFTAIKGPVDIAQKQHLIREFRDAIGHVEYTVTNHGKVEEPFWINLMTEWLNNLQAKYDKALHREQFNSTWIDKNVPDDVKLARKLVCNAGGTVDCDRVGKIRLVDEDGIINKEGFYNYVTAWYNMDSVMVYVAQAGFNPLPPHWINDEKMKIPPADHFCYSQIPFYLNGLVDSPATIDAIRKIRKVCDDFEEKGLSTYPTGIPFTFWEQYLHLKNNLLEGLGVISLAVFLVISILLVSPWTAVLIVSVLLMMVVELGGFMGIVGLKLNAISAVAMITAMGIGVEFTVHICLSYLTSLGSGNTRMAKTLNHMFIPVTHGGLSTLLGIIMLAFSDFEFIVRYFFMVMTALIILGLLNGLMLLPVILSLIGPRCEVRPVDGSDTLPPPSPKSKRRVVNGYSNGAAAPDADQLQMHRLPNGDRLVVIPASPVQNHRSNSLSTIAEEPTGSTPTPTNTSTPPADVRITPSQQKI